MFLTKKHILYLSFGIGVLAIINMVDFVLGKPLWTITKIFNLGSDCNFSAWYSSILLFLGALQGYFLWEERQEKEMLWFSFLLLFMSADEIAQFHETAGHLASKYLGLSKHSLFQHADWVWIFGPILIVLFVFMVRMLYRLYSGSKRAVFYLMLGFALIVLGGIFLESTINFLNHNDLQWIWDVEIIVEEVLEMLGSIALLYSMVLLDHQKSL